MYLIEAKNLYKNYAKSRHTPFAVNDVSLGISAGETVGLVGESGCGKTTLGKLLLQLEKATRGEIFFQEECISNYTFKQLQPLRKQIQMIFQANAQAFNPRFTVAQIIGEPFSNFYGESEQTKREKIVQMLEMVGLDASFLNRYAHEMSGGQKQRVGIARALILEPAFVVCDEVVSSVDYVLKRQIITLLQKMKVNMGLTYLFISHDISAVNAISDRVVVMYLGKIVEIIPKLDNKAKHPYSKLLLDAVLPEHPNKRRDIELGDVQDFSVPQQGCVFCRRCPYVTDFCLDTSPNLCNIGEHHQIACHLSLHQLDVIGEKIL